MTQEKREVVVVTGASAGVGRAIAHEFAQRGAHIALLARSEEGLQATQREVEERGGSAIIIPTDVAHTDQLEAAAEQTEMEFGPIDVWVNNAMTTVFAPFKDITPEEFKRATEVTYLGAVYGTMAALRRMLPRDRGVIVQVGSALSYRAIPLQSPYCGAKHAIRGFTDSIRCELLHEKSNVHITMVQLPGLNTPQFTWCKAKLPRHPQPVPPIFQPEVAARAVYWAAHHHRREVTVGWSAAKVIWGNKFFPSFGDWYLAKTGYDSQQTEDPVDPDRPSNLFEPVDEAHATRGEFENRSKSSTWQWWVNTHRGWIAAAAALAVVGAAAGFGWMNYTGGNGAITHSDE